MMKNIGNDESGSIAFEWIFVFTLLVIGIVGGLALLRDAVILEAGETAEAFLKMDTAYTVQAPPKIAMTNMKGGTTSRESGTLYSFSLASQVENNNITAKQGQ